MWWGGSVLWSAAYSIRCLTTTPGACLVPSWFSGRATQGCDLSFSPFGTNEDRPEKNIGIVHQPSKCSMNAQKYAGSRIMLRPFCTTPCYTARTSTFSTPRKPKREAMLPSTKNYKKRDTPPCSLGPTPFVRKGQTLLPKDPNTPDEASNDNQVSM